jgi:hypothetical protein
MILNKSELVANINQDISDQAYGQISPYDIRHNLLDIIDSIHNLTGDKDLFAANFATIPSGNTQVGQLALDLIKTPESNNSFNTAIGYSSLKSSYIASKNTAVGAYALSCNVYGEGNSALGYHALAGNTVGNLNVGIGSFALNNNKSGNGNIAIGHGAGYFVEKDASYKFYLASHPVDNNYICSNPSGTGLIPLLYGDLSANILGIGVKTLHNFGSLQTGGDITPSGNNILNLGHSSYKWRNLFLSSSLLLGDQASLLTDNSSNIRVSGSLVPLTNNISTLGSPGRNWIAGYFTNLTVEGTASINNLISLNTQAYSNKNLYLGVNSGISGIYIDSALIGGGLYLKSSTSKEYSITFYPVASGLQSFSGDNRATWRSNVSFQIPESGYVRSDSILSYDPNSYGLFFNSGITYFSRKDVLSVVPTSSGGHLAGIGNVNFISNSGQNTNYTLSVLSLESGVNVSQRFLSGAKVRQKDNLNSNKDKLRGFEIKYIDDAYITVGSNTDRLVIGSYDNTSKFINGVVLMKNSDDGSVFSVTNIPSVTENIVPNTIFNARSKNDCIGRFSSENNGFFKSSIQLLTNLNCELSGVELAYLNRSGVCDLTMFKDSGRIIYARLKDQQIGFLSSGVTNSTITIGHSGMAQLPSISLKDSSFVSSTTITGTVGYGKIYNTQDIKPYCNQSNSLFYIDASGNTFNLVVNKLDNVDGRAVYTDNNNNTFAGYLSPSGRKISGSIFSNTTFGSQALYSIKSGSGNLAIGHNSLYHLESGINNIVIGRESGSGLLASNKNIILGNLAFNRAGALRSTTDNIIIGNGIGSSHSGSFNFVVGNKSDVILLEGKLGPENSDKRLVMPNDGKLYLNNLDNTEGLSLRANIIEVIDSGGSNYPENSLNFLFSGNNTATLLTLDHNSNPMSNSVSYAAPSTVRPFAELKGDLKLRGSIRFSDGTSLESSSGIAIATNLANSGISLANIANSGVNVLNSIMIEGYMPNGMAAPSVASSPTSGLLVTKNSAWSNSASLFIFNRDTTSIIHSGAYVVAARINGEYKPIWVSRDNADSCCCDD